MRSTQEEEERAAEEAKKQAEVRLSWAVRCSRVHILLIPQLEERQAMQVGVDE